MGIRRNPEPGRQAVLWLATAFVILIGAAACTFIILVAVEHPSAHFVVLGAMIGGLVVLLMSLAVHRDKHRVGSWLRFWLAARGRTDPRSVLRIGRKRRLAAGEAGSNSPPTLDSVREAAEQNVSWVPHGPQPERPRPDRRERN